jgi:hypothetical protein
LRSNKVRVLARVVRLVVLVLVLVLVLVVPAQGLLERVPLVLVRVQQQLALPPPA